MSKLIAPIGRIVVKIDSEKKNFHTMENGTTIRIERKYNNFNRRETQPVNAEVVNGQNIPEGSEILCHHNIFHDVNKIFNYTQISGESESSSVQLYSIPENEAYIYRLPNTTEWLPCKGYATALRIFKPYNGILHGIEPEQLKDVLWVTSGEYKNMALKTLKAADYCLIFQDTNDKENRVIRFRVDSIGDRESEVIAILHDITDYVLNGELLIGLSQADCKKIK